MGVHKKKNIQYIGFNDFWFSVIGILMLSVSIVYIFNNPFDRLTLLEVIVTWVVALFFSTCDWYINRAILIRLRKKYPNLKDSVLRIMFLFIATTTTVIVVDFIGIYLFSLVLENVSYNFLERTRSLVVVILLTIMIMAIYEAIYFFMQLKQSIRDEEQAKQAIVQAQLDALRNQAQPHFFFNTLNTLRDIIDQNPKEDAKQFVDKLSEIYRFLLESGNANLILLKDELKFAKAYIHIQSERFGANLILNWNIPEAALNTMIVPMSLQLLLENAIKHNIISRAKPLEIHINIKDDYIVVNNRIQKKSTQLPSTKVGLKNIEKRYGLISNTAVIIVNDGHQFSVSLPLLKKPQ
ncbi:sensor histidine kinase [Aquimarina algicola]|uniref:Histidine kinase n=1 Tax=Aquimarina algicola TaxID=2589995 RepID=A0A504JCG1_9FLAO|nr:histidine kinase [Aquimarina algicola]TPN86282.1 histidine kinase [Aquimarina algicola]